MAYFHPVILRFCYLKKNSHFDCSRRFIDGTGAALPEGEARRHPPRRQAVQHSARREGQRQAVRFRYLGMAGRLEGNGPEQFGFTFRTVLFFVKSVLPPTFVFCIQSTRHLT